MLVTLHYLPISHDVDIGKVVVDNFIGILDPVALHAQHHDSLSVYEVLLGLKEIKFECCRHHFIPLGELSFAPERSGTRQDVWWTRDIVDEVIHPEV